jgi:DNA polymerase-4
VELGLACSLGIATNKLVAKIATDVGKGRVRSGTMPQAIFVVPPGDEAAFLAPLPATALWGVGPKTATKLADLGIHTVETSPRGPPRTWRGASASTAWTWRGAHGAWITAQS